MENRQSGTSSQAKDVRAFAGIDVAFAKEKALPICVVTWHERRLEPLDIRAAGLPSAPRGKGNRVSLLPDAPDEFANEAASVLEQLSEKLGLSIERIAIDAPSAPCAERLDRRRAELALDKLGISCIPTPTASRFTEIRQKCKAHLEAGGIDSRLPHANQLWMLVGFALFGAFRPSRTVLEVYPHAIVRRLGVASGHKTTKQGYRDQLAAAARATGWSDPEELEATLKLRSYGAKHDRLDAFLSAWIAALPESELEACGSGPDDVIWVPKCPSL